MITLNDITYAQSELKLIPTNSSWQQNIVDFLENWFDDSDTITVQTSGSTGIPKTYELKKESMLNSAYMTNDFFGMDVNKTALLCMPATYIAGKMMLVRAIAGGYNLLVREPSSLPFSDVNQIIDFVAVTPFQMDSVLDDVKAKGISSVPAIRNIIIGGAPVSSGLEAKIKGFPTAAYESYGMTETCSHIALRKLNKSDSFAVLDGVSIRQDDRACLLVYAPHLVDYELVTNDIVELVDDIRFRWLGRADFVINSGGVKIHPELVEKKLKQVIAPEFLIASQVDEKLGQKVVLLIESETEIASLEKSLKELLDKFEVPKEIFYVKQFVRSDNGKVLREKTVQQIS